MPYTQLAQNTPPTRSPAARDLRLVLLLVLGLALRLTGLDVHSFWYDEVQAVYVAGDPLAILHDDRHPPLFFLLLQLWMRLAGDGEAALRLLPALLGCVSLLLFAGLARRTLPERPALLATACFALAPYQVWYAQELRMYELLLLGTLVALHGAAPGRRSHVVGSALVFAGTAIALGSHYFGVLVPALVVAWTLARWRHDRRDVVWRVGAAAAGALVWVPWLLVYLEDQLHAPWGFAARLSARYLAELPVRHLLIMGSALPTVLVAAFVTLVAIGMVGCAVAALRGSTPARILLAGIALPMLFLLCLFLFLPPNFQANFAIPLSPVITMSVALGLDATTSRFRVPWPAWLLPAICLVATGLLRRNNLKEDYRTTVAELAAAWRPGDVVVAVTGTVEGPSEAGLRYYLRDLEPVAASIRALPDLLSDLRRGVPPPARIQVLFRNREYAEPDLARLRELATQVHAGDERVRMQHMTFTPGS